MATGDRAGVVPRRRRHAAARRAQCARSHARALQQVLRGFASLRSHRGCATTWLGEAFARALEVASGGSPEPVPPAAAPVAGTVVRLAGARAAQRVAPGAFDDAVAGAVAGVPPGRGKGTPLSAVLPGRVVGAAAGVPPGRGRGVAEQQRGQAASLSDVRRAALVPFRPTSPHAAVVPETVPRSVSFAPTVSFAPLPKGLPAATSRGALQPFRVARSIKKPMRACRGFAKSFALPSELAEVSPKVTALKFPRGRVSVASANVVVLQANASPASGIGSVSSVAEDKPCDEIAARLAMSIGQSVQHTSPAARIIPTTTSLVRSASQDTEVLSFRSSAPLLRISSENTVQCTSEVLAEVLVHPIFGPGDCAQFPSRAGSLPSSIAAPELNQTLPHTDQIPSVTAAREPSAVHNSEESLAHQFRLAVDIAPEVHRSSPVQCVKTNAPRPGIVLASESSASQYSPEEGAADSGMVRTEASSGLRFSSPCGELPSTSFVQYVQFSPPISEKVASFGHYAFTVGSTGVKKSVPAPQRSAGFTAAVAMRDACRRDLQALGLEFT